MIAFYDNTDMGIDYFQIITNVAGTSESTAKPGTNINLQPNPVRTLACSHSPAYRTHLFPVKPHLLYSLPIYA